jgi:hypothetical protein
MSTGRDPEKQDPAQLQPPEMVVGRVASGVEPRPAFPLQGVRAGGAWDRRVVGGNQLPASRTQTVVMDRRTVTEGDGDEQGGVP